ncbi:MAG: YggN family protein [Luteimonas sp.]|nr:YggN family protein [Luteimonas sp.]
MARMTLAVGLVLALACGPLAAQSVKITGSGSNVDINAECNISSDYEFHLTERSVVYTRKSGVPKRVLIRDGALFIDDDWVQVGAADAARLRDYERGARDAMPLAQKIGRDAAQIALAAVGEVAAVFSNDPAGTRAKLDEARKRIDARLQQAITPTRFSGDALGRGIGEAIGDVLPTFIGDVVGGALRAAFTGDASRFERIEGDLDTRIEAIVAPRKAELEANAREFCRRMEALGAIDDALEYRLPDGRPLSLLRVTAKAARD